MEETRQREEAGDRRAALKCVRAEEFRGVEVLLLLRGLWLVGLVLCLVWHGRGGRAMYALCPSVCVCVFVCCLFVFWSFYWARGRVCARMETRGWQ